MITELEQLKDVQKRKDLQDKIDEIGKIIDAPRSWLIVLYQPANDGSPYVAIDGDKFFYIYSERGCEIYREPISSLDELMYFILARAANRMALDHELDNRVEGQDFRRIYFSKRIELMNKLNPQWGERCRKEIEEILVSAPYSD